VFGVLIFALNESKFIGYALRSYLQSPLVKVVVVVEGCVVLNAQAANAYGLSRDGMADVIAAVMADDPTDRIIYERYGWAEKKAELRTRCIRLCEEWCPDVGYYLQTDGDEIITPDDLKILKAEIDRQKPDLVSFKYWHFWKQPDLVAVGSLWDAYIPRCYKNHGAGMYFTSHAGGPRRPGGFHLKVKFNSSVRVYHYGPMKNGRDVMDKLEFYRKRDNKGVDTWTDWKAGKATHWTHGGGGAVKFTGQHPPVIAGDVWKLIPE
jgi:hypothetical protein